MRIISIINSTNFNGLCIADEKFSPKQWYTINDISYKVKDSQDKNYGKRTPEQWVEAGGEDIYLRSGKDSDSVEVCLKNSGGSKYCKSLGEYKGTEFDARIFKDNSRKNLLRDLLPLIAVTLMFIGGMTHSCNNKKIFNKVKPSITVTSVSQNVNKTAAPFRAIIR